MKWEKMIVPNVLIVDIAMMRMGWASVYPVISMVLILGKIVIIMSIETLCTMTMV